jgi:hypothetical protein
MYLNDTHSEAQIKKYLRSNKMGGGRKGGWNKIEHIGF